MHRTAQQIRSCQCIILCLIEAPVLVTISNSSLSYIQSLSTVSRYCAVCNSGNGGKRSFPGSRLYTTGLLQYVMYETNQIHHTWFYDSLILLRTIEHTEKHLTIQCNILPITGFIRHTNQRRFKLS